MKIKAIVFDLDGTLANTLEDLADAVNYALEEYGLKTHSLEQYRYFVGNGMKKLIERSVGEKKELQNKVFESFAGYYADHFSDKTVAYDGEIELIKELKNRKIKLAVVTNKAHHMALKVAEKIYGKDVFTVVYGQSEEYPTKPDPTLTYKALSIMGVKKQDCLFVGDSDVDIFTAKNAGVKSVGVLWGFRTKEELQNAGADFLIQNPKDLLEIVK